MRDSAFQRGLVSSPVPVRALGAPGGSKCRRAVWPSQAVATAPPFRRRVITPSGANGLDLVADFVHVGHEDRGVALRTGFHHDVAHVVHDRPVARPLRERLEHEPPHRPLVVGHPIEVDQAAQEVGGAVQ